jgi:hypothetical protein
LEVKERATRVRIAGFTVFSERFDVKPMELRRALANAELGEDSDVEVALGMAGLSKF